MANRFVIQGKSRFREGMAEGVAGDVGEGLVLVSKAVNRENGRNGGISKVDWRTHAIQTPCVFQLITSP